MQVHEKSCLGVKVYGFNQFRNLKGVEYSVPDYEPLQEVNVDPNQSLFDLVFSINPDTKLPDGDIAMFMNDNTNPDIRRFIELNLHTPQVVDGDSAGQFSELDDDTIMELQRGQYESISSYRSRLFDYIKSQRELKNAE